MGCAVCAVGGREKEKDGAAKEGANATSSAASSAGAPSHQVRQGKDRLQNGARVFSPGLGMDGIAKINLNFKFL